MDQIEQECRELLQEKGIDISSEIDFDVNGKIHTLSFEYITQTFMQASNESKLVFFSALKKALNANEFGAEKFFEGMGQLLLMSHLSHKLEV